MTSKGQVTIPKALRQQLGLATNFGLLKSQRHPVPVDFDTASLLPLLRADRRRRWWCQQPDKSQAYLPSGRMEKKLISVDQRLQFIRIKVINFVTEMTG